MALKFSVVCEGADFNFILAFDFNLTDSKVSSVLWVCFKGLGVSEITLINTASLAIILPSCLDLVSSVIQIGKGNHYFFVRLYYIMLEIY